MADVSHELGSLRFVVDAPLSSKVAMFNNAVSKHQESQHLNPFSQTGGLPKPTFNKGEYGKPLAGSLTEARGQKANIHVLKEMLELCQIIDSEGYSVKDEPEMKVIPFGELFNIYTYISDKVVGILLRARKHKLVEFEGEVLFQRRDDDVPVFLLKPIKEIRQILEQKQDEIRRSVSPAPQATSVMMDQQRRGLTPSPSPQPTKPKPKKITEKPAEDSKVDIVKPIPVKATPSAPGVAATESAPIAAESAAAASEPAVLPAKTASLPAEIAPLPAASVPVSEAPAPLKTEEQPKEVVELPQSSTNSANVISTNQVVPETVITPPTPTAETSALVAPILPEVETNPTIVEEKTDVNNNEEAPAIVITSENAPTNTEEVPAEVVQPNPQ